MSFNASAVRGIRQAKNNQARVSRFAGGGQLPFVTPRDLIDGAYQFRLWPADPTKNPLGFLFNKTHTIEDDPELSWQCPRSNNWDPLPTHWEMWDASKNLWVPADQNLVDFYQDPEREPEEGDPYLTPVFAERCWACELEASMVEAGLKLDDVSKRLARWLGGDWSDGFKGLFGDESYNFPATIGVREHSRISKEGKKGKKYDVIEYCPDPKERFHCVLQFNPGELVNDLLSLIEACPDCSNIQVGRWFTLRKSNGGVGIGGYKLTMAPNPSPAGFEIDVKRYPNFQNWGKGNARYNRPSKRIPYAEVEAVGSSSSKWWAAELESHGIQLSDNLGEVF